MDLSPLKAGWPGLETRRAQLPRAEVVDGSQASHCLVHGILHESVFYVSTSGLGPFGQSGPLQGTAAWRWRPQRAAVQPERAFETGKAGLKSCGGECRVDYTRAEVGRGLALSGLGGAVRDPGRKEAGMLGTACANVLGQDSAGCW